jgi:hypothetical protein
MFHEWLAATLDMPFLLSELEALRAGSWASSGVPSAGELVLSVAKEDKLTLRGTVRVRFGFDLGFRVFDLEFLTAIDDIELNSADFAICSLILTSFSANFQAAFPQSSTRWPARFA